MTSPSSVKQKRTTRGDYGFARARDVAFDAIRQLWSVRQTQGVKQSDIAEILGKDTGWVSRQLSGPGNWTLRTLGELCEALDGELEIIATPLEKPIYPPTNFDAYSGYGRAVAQPDPGPAVFVIRRGGVDTSTSVATPALVKTL